MGKAGTQVKWCLLRLGTEEGHVLVSEESLDKRGKLDSFLTPVLMLFAPGCRVKGMCSLLEGWGCPFCNGKTREGGGWGAGEEGAEDRGVKDDAGAGDGVSEGYSHLPGGWHHYYPT